MSKMFEKGAAKFTYKYHTSSCTDCNLHGLMSVLSLFVNGSNTDAVRK